MTTLIATLGGAVAWPLFVDDQFKFGLLKDRQVGGCFAFENVAAVPGQTPKSSQRANVVQSSLSDASARLARQLVPRHRKSASS